MGLPADPGSLSVMFCPLYGSSLLKIGPTGQLFVHDGGTVQIPVQATGCSLLGGYMHPCAELRGTSSPASCQSQYFPMSLLALAWGLSLICLAPFST